MQIALLHYTLPPVIGGVERIVRDQAAALKSLGHEVRLFDRSPESRAAFREMLRRQTGAREVSGARTPPSAPGLLGQLKSWENEEALPYLECGKEISRHRHGLPHWQQDGKLFFVTWRLADALPEEKLRELRRLKQQWEEAHPGPMSPEQEDERLRHLDETAERWLASGHGSCLLRQPGLREPLVQTLHHGDGSDYDLLSYVIMPNHVHVLFRLRPGSLLEKTVQAWKSISSRNIGKLTGRKGLLWQEGYHDRLIRGPRHFSHALRYIEKNPQQAGLQKDECRWWQSGTEADVGVRTPKTLRRRRSLAVLVHNVLTMPFDLEWAAELRTLAAEAGPEEIWINWVHDVAAVNPHYAHLPWEEEAYATLSKPLPGALSVAVSEARRRDYARASGLPVEQIRVIPNGLDFAQILGLTPRIAGLRLEERELVLVHPARLIRRKNIELGLRVTACLRAAGCDVLYAVTGAPDPHQKDGLAYHQELKKLADELDLAAPATGLPGVRFLGEEGELSEADVRALYAAGDALFFPSTGEGFGLPLVEAAVHRLTVFCSNLPVHEEVLGAAAIYFEATEDPAAISARIMQWWRACPFSRHRRQLWRRHEMAKICQEHLEPLLAAANQST